MYIRCVTIAFSTLSNAFFLRLNISVYPMHFFLIFRPVCASSQFISVLMSTQYFLSCLQCLSNQNFFWYLILLCFFLFCCIYLMHSMSTRCISVLFSIWILFSIWWYIMWSHIMSTWCNYLFNTLWCICLSDAIFNSLVYAFIICTQRIYLIHTSMYIIVLLSIWCNKLFNAC